MRLRRQLNLAISSLCSVVIFVGCAHSPRTFDTVNVAQERVAPAAVMRAPSPLVAADGAILFSRWLAVVRWRDGIAFATVLAEIRSRELDAASKAVEAAAPASTATVASSGDGFLACTRAHESDATGGYGAVSPGGTYRGAYQFLQSTWDSTAGSAGRPDLIGVDPATAAVADQDSLALALYGARGNQPWGGRC